jgi:CelD/BcsL family acetyltransferase involved in cellulose biosynthesis
MAAVPAPALEWLPARRSLRFTFGEYCFHETWCEGLELLTHVTRIKTSLDEITAAIVPLLQRHAVVILPSFPVNTRPAPLDLTRRYLRYTLATDNHYYIELDRSSFDEYLRGLSRHHRHEIQRKLRRYLQAIGGTIEFRRYSTPQEARIFYDLARPLSAKTYQDRLLGRGLPDTDAFRAELDEHAARGTMRGYLLFHREQPVAFGYCSAVGDCLRFVFTGYDPALATWSPGIVLVHEMLRSITGEGRFAVLDFGSGEAQYKRLFATESQLCATVFFFRPTPGHLIKVLTHRCCIAASDGFGTAAARLGIKARLKRLWRARAAARPA